MLLALALGIIALYAVAAVYRTCAWLVSWRWMRKQLDNPPKSVQAPARIVLLVPGLREQSLVKETVRTFAALPYQGPLAVMFISTEKERAEKDARQPELSRMAEALKAPVTVEMLETVNSGLFPRTELPKIAGALQSTLASEWPHVLRTLYQALPSTADLIVQEIAELEKQADGPRPRLFHVHYPETTGRKGSQMNFAIQRLPTLLPDWSEAKTYAGIYDFDARPDRQTLAWVGQAAENLPAMLQQIQVPLAKLNRFAGRGLHGALMRGNALVYLRHALGLELFRLLLANGLDRLSLPHWVQALLQPSIYGIGTGMFVRVDRLRETGLFPEPGEDLEMGYRMRMLGETIVPLPVVAFVEPFYRYRQMLDAFGNSFLNSLLVARAKRDTAKLTPARRRTEAEKNALILKEWVECVVWTSKLPVLLIAYGIFFLHFGAVSWATVLLAMLPWFLRLCVDPLLLLQAQDWISRHHDGAERVPRTGFLTNVLIGMSGPVQGIVGGLPPLWALARTVRTSLTGTPARTKTER
jgi:hypothetical protein